MLIRTTHGDLPEDTLEKRIVEEDYPDAHVIATEYWLADELVHRSVHAELKPSGLFQVQANPL